MTQIQLNVILCVVESNATWEVIKVANVKKLKSKIEQSGMTMKAVSEKSGIVRETLYNRLNGIGEFTASEIVGLSKALNLTIKERDSIFLN